MSEEFARVDTQYMFEVMLHFLNGGEVVSKPCAYGDEDDFELDLSPLWNWERYHYRKAPIKRKLYTIYNGDSLTYMSQDINEVLKITKNPLSPSYGKQITTFIETKQ